MSSGWLPGWPVDPIDGYGPLDPIANTWHRTYGAWGGDYAVIKANGLAQLLIGKDEPRRVQFMPIFRVAYHCNGSNFKSWGIEVEGTNDDTPTQWQIDSIGEVIEYARTLDIPTDYLDPFSAPQASVWVNGGRYRGHISHYSVRTDDGSSQHSDLIAVADFQRALGGAPTPAPRPPEDDDMMILIGPVYGRIGNVAHLVAGSLILDDGEWSEDKGGGSNGVPNTVYAWNLKPGHGYKAKFIDTAHMKKLRHANGL